MVVSVRCTEWVRNVGNHLPKHVSVSILSRVYRLRLKFSQFLFCNMRAFLCFPALLRPPHPTERRLIEI